VELAVCAADKAFYGERLDVLEIDDSAGDGGAGLVVDTTVNDALYGAVRLCVGLLKVGEWRKRK